MPSGSPIHTPLCDYNVTRHVRAPPVPGPTRRGRAAKHSVAAGDTGGPGHAVTATRRAAVRSNDTAESVTPARPCRSLSGAAGRAASERAARAGTCVCVSVNFCASQNSILSNIEKCANKPYFRGRSKTSTRLGSPPDPSLPQSACSQLLSRTVDNKSKRNPKRNGTTR